MHWEQKSRKREQCYHKLERPAGAVFTQSGSIIRRAVRHVECSYSYCCVVQGQGTALCWRLMLINDVNKPPPCSCAYTPYFPVLIKMCPCTWSAKRPNDGFWRKVLKLIVFRRAAPGHTYASTRLTSQQQCAQDSCGLLCPPFSLDVSLVLISLFWTVLEISRHLP